MHKFKLGDIVVHRGNMGQDKFIAKHHGVVTELISRECSAGIQYSYYIKWAHGGLQGGIATQPLEHQEIELSKYEVGDDDA